MVTFVIYLFIIATISQTRAGLNTTIKNAITAKPEKFDVPLKQNQSTVPSCHTKQLPVSSKFTVSSNVTDGVAKFPIPYHVSIQMITNNQYKHLCAGTITDESFVLTAAHCFHKTKNPKRISIVVGSNKLSTTKGLRYNVSKIIIHDFFEPLFGWDVALLKIHPKLVFDGKRIDKISLNFSAQVYAEMDTFMVGWGQTKVNVSQYLEVVSFRTIDNKKCKKRGFIHITNTEVCAISYKGRGACDGDSGGPLVNTDFSTQLGILSYGRELCKRGRIYAFTYIHPLIDWIFDQMRLFR